MREGTAGRVECKGLWGTHPLVIVHDISFRICCIGTGVSDSVLRFFAQACSGCSLALQRLGPAFGGKAHIHAHPGNLACLILSYLVF